METHKVIYLQMHELSETTWCEDRTDEDDIKYIHPDELIDAIIYVMNQYEVDGFIDVDAYEKIDSALAAVRDIDNDYPTPPDYPVPGTHSS